MLRESVPDFEHQRRLDSARKCVEVVQALRFVMTMPLLDGKMNADVFTEVTTKKPIGCYRQRKKLYLVSVSASPLGA